MNTVEFHILPEYKDKIRWFEDSPDTGEPECICSFCGEVIGIPRWELDEDENDEIAIRAFDSEQNLEARFHVNCFGKVTGTKIAESESQIQRSEAER